MNKERILVLATLIEQQPHTFDYNSDGFNMDHFVHGCGTPSCIAGWAAWESLGRPEKLDEVFDKVEANATAYLGLLPTAAATLFWGASGLSSITPAQAATCLRNLAETGTVDWPLAMSEGEAHA